MRLDRLRDYAVSRTAMSGIFFVFWLTTRLKFFLFARRDPICECGPEGALFELTQATPPYALA